MTENITNIMKILQKKMFNTFYHLINCLFGHWLYKNYCSALGHFYIKQVGYIPNMNKSKIYTVQF